MERRPFERRFSESVRNCANLLQFDQNIYFFLHGNVAFKSTEVQGIPFVGTLVHAIFLKVELELQTLSLYGRASFFREICNSCPIKQHGACLDHHVLDVRTFGTGAALPLAYL